MPFWHQSATDIGSVPDLRRFAVTLPTAASMAGMWLTNSLAGLEPDCSL
jgi:hypothetical protein